MEPSSLGGLPLNMGQSKGIPMLCREYLDTYLEENLGLDPNAVVKVQGEL